MPVLGFRFGNFTYITDANRIEKTEKQKISGSETMVLNALRKNEHISHFNLQEAIATVDELEIPNAYFTHISHQLGTHEEISKELLPNRKLAWDGLTLEF
jgi:phosphoribosyl 1,2-cyclic phosphate phosphodiesterase